MGIYYHATSKENKERILKEGFTLGENKFSHSIGNGAYFSDVKENTEAYGEVVITVELDDSKIMKFDSVARIKDYIYEKTRDISMRLLKSCLAEDNCIGVKVDDMAVIYFMDSIKIIE